MPFFRIDDRLHYYAHVPKCAGTSVEAYLEDRFGPLAFVNRRYLNDPEARRWTKSSPQHVPLDALYKLVPDVWIASSFAVVRHPLSRLCSTFGFQAGVEGTVPADWTINEFFADWLTRENDAPFLYDGHLLPQTALVPADAAAFRIEDGLDAVIGHLDGLAGNRGGPRAMPVVNVKQLGGETEKARLVPSPGILSEVETYYAEDFARFGYTMDTLLPLRTPNAKPPGLARRLARALRRG